MVLTLRDGAIFYEGTLPDVFPERWAATLCTREVTASSLDSLREEATKIWKKDTHQYDFNAILLTDIVVPKKEGEFYSGMSCGYRLDHRRKGFDMDS